MRFVIMLLTAVVALANVAAWAMMVFGALHEQWTQVIAGAAVMVALAVNVIAHNSKRQK